MACTACLVLPCQFCRWLPLKSTSENKHKYIDIEGAKIDCLSLFMCPLLAQLKIGFFSSFSDAAVYSTNEANKAGLKVVYNLQMSMRQQQAQNKAGGLIRHAGQIGSLACQLCFGGLLGLFCACYYCLIFQMDFSLTNVP